jgi:hypothetical protein
MEKSPFCCIETIEKINNPGMIKPVMSDYESTIFLSPPFG